MTIVESCIFCAIVAGDAPAHRVFENEHTVAFLDIRPISRGHVLVVPREHSADLTSTGPETAAEVFRVGHTLARAVRARGRVDPVLVKRAQDLPKALVPLVRDGDLVLLAGAGDIGQVAHVIAGTGRIG